MVRVEGGADVDSSVRPQRDDVHSRAGEGCAETLASHKELYNVAVVPPRAANHEAHLVLVRFVAACRGIVANHVRRTSLEEPPLWALEEAAVKEAGCRRRRGRRRCCRGWGRHHLPVMICHKHSSSACPLCKGRATLDANEGIRPSVSQAVDLCRAQGLDRLLCSCGETRRGLILRGEEDDRSVCKAVHEVNQGIRATAMRVEIVGFLHRPIAVHHHHIQPPASDHSLPCTVDVELGLVANFISRAPDCQAH
mmetsp:Transcript_46471/g.120229  ORF Transcript_46471/g.120229 Transcript_46471/m.120229 type:complete len:252 (+) Transcript_46471:2476-3231(+)